MKRQTKIFIEIHKTKEGKDAISKLIRNEYKDENRINQKVRIIQIK